MTVHSPAAGTPLQHRPMRPVDWAAAAALALLSVLLMLRFQVGYISSDDTFYLHGAQGWLGHVPYVGLDHWELRHTLVLPLALSIRLFGLHEWAMTLVTQLYYLAFLGVNGWFLRRHFGGAVAVIGTLLVLVSPGMTVVATYVVPDISELFFVSTAFWLLVDLRQSAEARPWAWAAMGAVAGLGVLNRQTAAAFALFAGLMFCFAPGTPRRRWWPAVAAFVLVVVGEWACVTAMTGDPMYRLKLDFNHDPTTRTVELQRAKGKLFDMDGNVSVSLVLDPLLNLMVSQKYPLLFWLAVPGAWWAWRVRATAQGRVLMPLLALGLVSFLFVGANPKLLLVKRYFVPVAWVMATVGAWCLVRCWQLGRRRLAAATLALAVVAGLGALSVERTDPRMAERALARWVQQHPGERIYTDPETLGRSNAFFVFNGLSQETVSASPAPPGSLLFHCPACIPKCVTRKFCVGREQEFEPKADWQVLEQIEGPRTPLGALVHGLGVEGRLPREVAQKLVSPAGEAVVYRLPASRSGP